MTIDILTELETCVKSVSQLSSAHVSFGIDPVNDNMPTSLPRVSIFSFTPSEIQRFPDVSFMAYPIRICYYFALSSAYPSDKAGIAALQNAGLLVRQAQRWIEQRQTTGACTIPMDVIDDPKTEMGISDNRGFAVCNFTLQLIEPRL